MSEDNPIIEAQTFYDFFTLGQGWELLKTEVVRQSMQQPTEFPNPSYNPHIGQHTMTIHASVAMPQDRVAFIVGRRLKGLIVDIETEKKQSQEKIKELEEQVKELLTSKRGWEIENHNLMQEMNVLRDENSAFKSTIRNLEDQLINHEPILEPIEFIERLNEV